MFEEGVWTVNPQHVAEVASGQAVMPLSDTHLVYAREPNKRLFSKISKSKGLALDHVSSYIKKCFNCF